MNNKLFGDWYSIIKPELELPNGIKLREFIKKEYQSYNILPSSKDIFRAFRETPMKEVKVIILGQSPYPNKIDACG